MTGPIGQLFAFNLPDQHTALAVPVLERPDGNHNRRSRVPGCSKEWNSRSFRPDQTIRVARAAIPKSKSYMTLRDELGFGPSRQVA